MKTIRLLFAVTVSTLIFANSVWAQTEQEKEPAPTKQDYDNRVLVKVGNESLTAWQVDTMIQYGAARDEMGAVNMWINLQLQAQEAKRRGLDKEKDKAFILDLFAKNFLANRILMDKLNQESPKADETQAKVEYEKNKDRYRKPFTASIQHITVAQRDIAQKIIQQAQKPEADFNKLYDQYSVNKDRRKGKLMRVPFGTLQRIVGKKAADALKTAQTGQIIGPFLGVRGFEVVKVDAIVQPYTMEFDKVKNAIVSQLNQKNQMAYREKFIQQLKDKANIEKSDQVKSWEKKAQQEQKARPDALKKLTSPPNRVRGRTEKTGGE